MKNIYLIRYLEQKRIKLYIFTITCFLIPLMGYTQTGPCYIFDYSTGNSYDTLTAASSIEIPLFVDDPEYDTWDEGLSQAIPIGFTFVYNFKPYTKFKVNANGFVTLDENLAWNDELWWNYLESSARKLILAPLWDDLVLQPQGKIRYNLTGSVGSRILKIDYNNLSFFLGGNFHLKFQVWLYEGSNIIEFRYGDDGSILSWANYVDGGGINIGLNDERDSSFMSITPGLLPTYSFSVDEEISFLGMENYVNDGLVYKFTPAIRWQGTTSSDWLTKTNWELDTIPSSLDLVQIPGGKANYPVITGSTTAENLIVESGAELKINGGGELTVDGDLNSAGTISVTSTSETSNGSLIIKGTSNATITFERYLTGLTNWHLISSPVIGQDIWSWATQVENNIAINTSRYGITTYVEGDNDWNTYPSSNPEIEFSLGKGYSTLRQADGLISFTGTINLNDVDNIPISYMNQGWNLIGNPFTSAIGATNSASSSDHLLSSTNLANLDENYAGIYLWDPHAGISGDYVIVNNAGGTPNGTLSQNYIQAGQGFFVRARDNSSRTFDISREMQAHQAASPLKSSNNLWPTIKLTAISKENSSNTIVRFNSNMTTGLDITYDAGMFRANPNFAIYTRLVDDNGIDFAIQCLPEDYSNLVIPLGLDAPIGTEVIISAQLFNLPEDCQPYLEDRRQNKFVALEPGTAYSVTIDENYKNSEFLFIHTSNSEVTQSDVIELKDPFKVIAIPSNGYIQVISSERRLSQVQVFDISGRVLASQQIYEGNDNRIYFTGSPGIYVVQVKNKLHSFSQKIFWNK